MAVLRSVNIAFWTDPYVQELQAREKLLFLYFLTNPSANLAGAFEVSIKTIAFHTDIPGEFIEKAFEKFTTDKKVYYVDGYVVLVNHQKHQHLNDSMRKNIHKILAALPANVKASINGKLPTPSIQADDSLHSPLPEVESKEEKENKKEKKGKSIAERSREFRQLVLRDADSKYAKVMLTDFIDYWNEPNRSHTTLRHEGEKFFDLAKRLATWHRRDNDYGKRNKSRGNDNEYL